MAETIAIVNQKGGVGKTTTCVNLCAALTEAGRRVLLCDFDPQANSTSGMGVDKTLSKGIYDALIGGTAVADVLFGDYNPAGRLPVTFYKSTAQLPDFEDYNMTGRTYRYMTEEPLFPFGHGLSYTTFSYGKASLDQKARAGKENSLTLSLTNTGSRDGDEVVQVYVRNLQDPQGPKKSLRAFKRVHLRAGETQKVRIDLRASTFDFFDPATGSVWCKPGKYEILYGGTSADNGLKRFTVTVK